MATLTVWKFQNPRGAENALKKLADLQKQQLIQVLDAAIVTWEPGRKRPKTYQVSDMVGAGFLSGAFWGLLFGILFFMPFLGMAMGAAAGAISGHFSDYGIDDSFIKEIQSKVTEGTSALFLMTGQVTLDKVEAAFTPEERGELIQSNLSGEQEAKLRADFGTEA